MSVDNEVFKQLVDAISPIISIGVGSAVIKVCTANGLEPNNLVPSDLAVLKPAIIKHYEKFWKKQRNSIEEALSSLSSTV